MRSHLLKKGTRINWRINIHWRMSVAVALAGARLVVMNVVAEFIERADLTVAVWAYRDLMFRDPILKLCVRSITRSVSVIVVLKINQAMC